MPAYGGARVRSVVWASLLCVALIILSQWRISPVVAQYTAPSARELRSAAFIISATLSLIVTKTADTDDGLCDADCSLREAISTANAADATTASVISFSIPTSDPGYQASDARWIIALDSVLPRLTHGQITIDGGNVITIDGSLGSSDPNSYLDDGLYIVSGSNDIRNLAIKHFYYTGIYIVDFDNDTSSFVETSVNKIENIDIQQIALDSIVLEGNNTTQTLITGSRLINNDTGIRIINGAHDNRIGGASAGERNIIAGYHAYGGISIESSNRNTISGNWIGISDAQTGGENTGPGIVMTNSFSNTIGGTNPYAGNVISGNAKGIWIDGGGQHTIAGNWIGLSGDGSEPLGNQQTGILLNNSDDNLIGGTTTSARNVIAASKRADGTTASSYGSGLSITGTSQQNRVIGNYIGTNNNGIPYRFGNDGYGIWVSETAHNNRIGDTITGAGNVLIYNGQGGVRVDTDDNTIAGNRIGIGPNGTMYGNGNSGIRVSGSHNTVGPSNLIAQSRWSGIMITGSDSQVLRNTIQLNARSGICLTGPRVTISENVISNNGGSTDGSDPDCQVSGGIVMDGASVTNTSVYTNTIYGNIGVGIAVYAGRYNRFTGNSISDNTVSGISLQENGNENVPAPIITQVDDTAVAGSGACAGCLVEVYSDDSNQGRYLSGRGPAESDGTFQINALDGRFQGQFVTVTQTDANNNTSAFASSVCISCTQVRLPLVVR